MADLLACPRLVDFAARGTAGLCVGVDEHMHAGRTLDPILLNPIVLNRAEN
jgi:hypothetical protein